MNERWRVTGIKDRWLNSSAERAVRVIFHQVAACLHISSSWGCQAPHQAQLTRCVVARGALALPCAFNEFVQKRCVLSIWTRLVRSLLRLRTGGTRVRPELSLNSAGRRGEPGSSRRGPWRRTTEPRLGDVTHSGERKARALPSHGPNGPSIVSCRTHRSETSLDRRRDRESNSHPHKPTCCFLKNQLWQRDQFHYRNQE